MNNRYRVVVLVVLLLFFVGAYYFFSPEEFRDDSLLDSYPELSSFGDDNRFLGGGESKSSLVVGISSSDLLDTSSFSCVNGTLSDILYYSYGDSLYDALSGMAGGWDSVRVLDCGEYYAIYSMSGSYGPSFFGPYTK